MAHIWLYLAAVLLNAVNLFLQVFFAVMFADLESDYINPVDLCSKLNVYILPEAGLHMFVTSMLLFSGQWFAVIVNLPLLGFNIRKIVNKQYQLDPTQIFRTVHGYKRETFVKLGFHLLLFFFYLYCMIMNIVMDEDMKY